MCVLCTPLPMLQEIQKMMSVIGCSARRGRKVNACHLHQTASTCKSNEQITSPSFGRRHFMPSKHCQSQMGMAGRLQTRGGISYEKVGGKTPTIPVCPPIYGWRSQGEQAPVRRLGHHARWPPTLTPLDRSSTIFITILTNCGPSLRS